MLCKDSHEFGLMFLPLENLENPNEDKARGNLLSGMKYGRTRWVSTGVRHNSSHGTETRILLDGVSLRTRHGLEKLSTACLTDPGRVKPGGKISSPG